MKSFILASQSPIRKKILSDLKYSFSVTASNAPESFNIRETLEQNAERLALEKAQAVQKEFPDEIIVGSDSIMVDCFGTFLEKPKDRADAKKMMQNRSGSVEAIVSGLAIVHGDQVFISHEKTIMKWRVLSDENIEFLLDSSEWKGKCGGVMVEGLSGLFLERIEGSLITIMGFALGEFERGMKEFR